MPERAAVESNEDGWQARLELRLESVQGRTRLTHCRHSGPLRVQRTFFPERMASAVADEPCHIYVLHPPGGLVSGDVLQIQVDCRRRAHALLTTPAAGKFYRQRGEQEALVTQELRLDGGTLEWLPQENIYYPDSAVRLGTRVRLDPSARFIGWELHCLGLPAIGATLNSGVLRTSLELWLGAKALLLERLALQGESLTARWGLANFPAFGTCVAYPARTQDLEQIRTAASSLNCDELMVACTIVDGVLCCRGLARRADHLKRAFIELWRALRPCMLGREAVAPRIWAT